MGVLGFFGMVMQIRKFLLKNAHMFYIITALHAKSLYCIMLDCLRSTVSSLSGSNRLN